MIWKVRDRPRRTRSLDEKRGDVAPFEEDRALGRLDHAGQQIDQRRLAGAVGADQRLARAGLRAQNDTLSVASRAPNCLMQAARLESRAAHAASPRSGLGTNGGGRATDEILQPVAADHHQDHEQQPDPELPVFRRRRRDDVAQHDEDRRADDAAVEIAGAADDQHQHHVGRAMEVEEVERDDLRRLGEQRAGGAGVGRRHCIDRDDAPVRGDAERAGAQPVLADRRQRQPERRLAQPARQREQDEQDDEAVERGVALAGEADREQAEHRAHREVEPVRAAGQPAVAVGEFAEQQRHAERHHQPGQIGAAQQQRRGDEAEHGGDASAPTTRPSVGSAKPWLARIAAA